MKRFKKIAYAALILISIVLGYVIYSISASNKEDDIKEKVASEISYFESKLIYMFNSLNNVEYENYKISEENISEKSKKASENTSSAGNGDDSSGGSSKENSSEGEEEGKNENKNSSSNENIQKYSLNTKGILNTNMEINWNYIKNEAELLHNSISTMTLDLYKINIPSQNVLNFGKEYDNLLVTIKDENKEECLKELTILYSFIPKFIVNCNTDNQTEIIYSTKYSIFKAYSLLDSENWENIDVYIKEASNKFSKLLTDINIQNKNQFIVNKCYILINELQNSINLKNKEIFLIKYRNLLEDLNNI